MSLLSICGGKRDHMYIEQVSLWKDYEGGWPIIWTKWVMTKVIGNGMSLYIILWTMRPYV